MKSSADLRVLLLAAGSQSRWHRGGGQGKKQLIKLRGETVIHRAYRLATERCSDVLTLVHDPDDETWAGLNPAKPSHEPWMGEMGKFLDGWDHWPKTGEIAVIYADAFYTEATMDTILDPAPVDQPVIYGRARGGERQHESFGIRFDVQRDWEEVVRVAYECVEHGMNVRGGPWHWFFRRHTGTTGYNTRTVAELADPENGWIEVGHDETDDFDTPEDLKLWKAAFGAVTA